MRGGRIGGFMPGRKFVRLRADPPIFAPFLPLLPPFGTKISSDRCVPLLFLLSLSLPPFLLLEGSCTRKRACNRRWINSICLVNRLAYRGKRCSRFNLYGSYEGVNYPRHRGARLPPIDAIPPTFFPITIFPH